MTNNDINIHNLRSSDDIDSSQTTATTTTYAQVRRGKRKYVIYGVIGVVVIILAVVITTTIVLTKKKTNTTTTVTTEEPPTAEVMDNRRWKQDGTTVAGSHKQGSQLNQLDFPEGFDIDDDLTLYIADSYNNRIVRWKVNATQGELVAGGNGIGDGIDQLHHPIDVVIDKQKNSLIICDNSNSRLLRLNHHHLTQKPTIILDIFCQGVMIDNNEYLYISTPPGDEIKRWKEGQSDIEVVAGGNGMGNALNQLINAFQFFVDHNDGSIYISDSYNHRVMKWLKNAKEGIIVAGGNGSGSGLDQINSPRGIVVDDSGNIYVADSYNHRIMQFSRGSQEGTVVVGGNGDGPGANQLDRPRDILFDREGNLYVADCFNHRIQKFFVDK